MAQGEDDGGQDGVAVAGKIAVADTKDAEARRFEGVGSRFVERFSFWLLVFGAVEFNDQLCAHADEIDDVIAQRHLAAKLDLVEPAISQKRPEKLFAMSLISAQIPRSLCRSRRFHQPRHHTTLTLLPLWEKVARSAG